MNLSKVVSFYLMLGVVAAGCTVAVSHHSPGTPAQRAAADASAILGEFVPPPGAVRLAKQPALPGGWAGYPVMQLNSTAQADVTAYWRVRGSATALLAWEKAHISRSFSGQDVLQAPPTSDTVYSLPALGPRRRPGPAVPFDVGPLR
jgi:hypothetical protein